MITPLEDENIFYEDLDEYRTKISLFFPQVKEGSIIELSYQKSTLNIFTLEPWYFQHDIPTLYSSLSIKPFKRIEHLFILNGVELNDGKNSVWVEENVPALKEEPFVRNMSNFRKKMKFELKDYKRTYSSNFGAYVMKSSLFETWEELHREMYKGNTIIYGRSPDEIGRKLVDSIKSANMDTLQMMKAIYTYVRDSVEWNGKLSFIHSPWAEPILQQGSGNSGEINSALCDLLNEVGIPSDPLLISTRDHGAYLYNYPSITQFNHLICAAQIGQKIYFLDAINPHRSWDQPAAFDLNDHGMLINPRAGGWLAIPDQYEAGRKVLVNARLSEDGNIKGNITEMYSGYAAVDLRGLIVALEEEGADITVEEIWEKRVTDGNPDTRIDSIKIEHLHDPENQLIITYDIETEDFTSRVGDFIYLDPMMIFSDNENPFLDKNRTHPVDFNYHSREDFVLNLYLPETFQVAQVPQNQSVIFPGKIIEFRFLCQAVGSQVSLTSMYHRKQSEFGVEAYPYLRELYDKMLARQGEQIVLKKKE